LKIHNDVAFFKAIKAQTQKFEGGRGRSPEDLDIAVRQIVSKVISTEEVIDIFAAAGLNKPEISVLSDEFLGEVKSLPQKNLAIEMLQKLLNDEIHARSRKNLVQSRRFSEMLENTIRKYQNRAIQTAIVIEELLDLAKEMREAYKRGEEKGLSEAELTFYDALEVNDSAVKILGDETLRKISQELVKAVKQNVTLDWSFRESVRAKMRIHIKRILRNYNYPPDKQESATNTVLAQAELLCRDLVA
jgi:type I restriction enzyme R subunit